MELDGIRIAKAVVLALVDLINQLSSFVQAAFTAVAQRTAEIHPSQTEVLWLQLVVGLLTILWIIFQFAWLRRLNEVKLEKFLEAAVRMERDVLADERQQVVAQLERLKLRRGLMAHLMSLWAEICLAQSWLLRLLSFGTTRGLANHNMLLLEVGKAARAREIYSDIASDALRKIDLYRDAIHNKQVEAQNAFIFAGRVALLEGMQRGAVGYFEKAKAVAQDADAHLFIGKQVAAESDYDGALQEFDAGLNVAVAQRSLAAEANLRRARAEVLMRMGKIGIARGELQTAKNLDRRCSNYEGLGRTLYVIGKLHARRPDHKRAAMQAFEDAAKNFDLAALPREVRRARYRIRELQGGRKAREGIALRILDLVARDLTKRVDALRARGRKIEA